MKFYAALIESFLSPQLTFSLQPFFHDDGSIQLPELDNQAIGTNTSP